MVGDWSGSVGMRVKRQAERLDLMAHVQFLASMPRQEFLEEKAVQLLAEIQAGLYAEAKARLDGNIKSGVTDWKGVEDYYAGSDDDFKGWLKVSWSKPTGAELDAVDTKLKGLKLTIRNAPLQQPDSFAVCLFTGKPGVEEILIGRAY